MAKGIKKIKWIVEKNKLSNPSTAQSSQKLLEINGDTTVYFEIAEWLSGTTSEQKQGYVNWLILNDNFNLNKDPFKKKASERFGFYIPKKLCGNKKYYIEAAIGTGHDWQREAGMWVRGSCDPKVTDYGWNKKQKKSLEKMSISLYAQKLYLTLVTEGLNNNSFEIEIYQGQKTQYSVLIDTLKVKTIDGEAIVEADTRFWTAKSKVKPGAKVQYFLYLGIRLGEILWPLKDNPLSIYITNNPPIEITKTPPWTNTTTSTIGKADTKPSRVAPCNFKQLVIYENGEPVKVFDQGVLLSKITDKDHFHTIKKIYYDFDKYYIREKDKPILDEIAEFLKENPFYPVELGSHTDVRGTDTYNKTLSQKRAQSAVDYLVSKGIPNKITARGYGKTMLVHKGENITEAQHQENRRTTLKFLVHGSNAQTIVVETTTPSYASPKDYKVRVNEWSVNKCYRNKDKHELTIKVREESILHTNKISNIKSGETYPVYSIVKSDFIANYAIYLLKYLTPFPELGKVTNDFFFYINSCAYYASKNMPTLHLKTYPDIIWAGHFQYNYKEKGNYYFHDREFTLKTGISDVIDEYINSPFFKILKYFPLTAVSSWITEAVVFPYIKSQAEDYTYGAHVIYEREAEAPGAPLSFKGEEVNLITQTKYTKYAAAAPVYAFVCVGIIIDLLMIYLTRGQNLKGRIAKLAKKVKQVTKFLDDNNLELYPPSIAINTGMYYYMDSLRRMSLVYEANIKANPLVAVGYKKEFDLVKDFLKGDSDKNKQAIVADLGEKGTFSVKAIVEAEGAIIFEDNVKYSILTQTYSFAEQVHNILQLNNKWERAITEQIKVNITVDADFRKTFRFVGIETSIEGKMDLDLYGGAALKLQYGVEKEKGLYVQEILVFSGIKGTYSGKIKANTMGGFFQTKKEIKPTPFTLIEPKEYPLFKVHLFNQQKT